MAIIPFSSSPRIAQDAQSAADAREADAAERERRYRAAADAKLKELRATGVKKFDAQGGTPMINIPDPVAPGGARLNAPGIETPDMREPGGYFSDSYQPNEGDALWNQYEADRTGLNKDIGYVDLRGQSRNGVGGPQQDIADPALETIAQDMIARQKERAGAADEATNRTRALNAPNPDQAAQAQTLSAKNGANRLDVLNNLDTYKRIDLADRLDMLRRQAPKLKTWLDSVPENFEVAHDDVENLSWWAQIGQGFARTEALKAAKRDGAGMGALTDYPLGDNLAPGVANVGGVVEGGKAIGQSLAAGYATTSSGVAGMLRMPFELNDQFASWVSGRKIESAPSQYMTRLQTAAQLAAADWRYKSDDPTIQGLLSGVESLPTSAFTIAATMLTGGAASPLLGAATGGALTAGDKYGQMREQGASALDSTGVALAHGILETAFEIPELKWLVGDLEQGVPFLQMMYKQAAVQVITENGARLTQDFLDWQFLPENKGKPFEEYLNGRFMAAYQTTLAALVGTGVQTTGAKALDAAMLKIDEGYQQKRSEDLANFVRAMGDNAKDSKLLKRLPEKYREGVAAITKDGPRENVLVYSEAIQSLAQTVGKTPEELAQAFRIDPAEMVSAIDAGEYISIPVGNYAAVIQTAKSDLGVSGETIYGALQDDIKFSKDEATVNEHKEWAAIQKAERDEALKLAETDQAFADSADRIRAEVLDKVRATGRYSEDMAASQAEMAANIFLSIPANTGEDVDAFWKQHGPNLLASVTGEQRPDALSQGIGREAVPVSDAELSYAAEDLNPQEFEAWKGAREGLSNEAIAERMNAAEPDVVYSKEKIAQLVYSAKQRGFDSGNASQSYYNRGKDPKTLRLIDLRAKGLSNRQIADALYPDVPTPDALNRVKALASKNKAAVAERKAAMGAGVLAQQDLGGTFTPPQAGKPGLISIFEKRNVATLSHEAAHWYLDTLWRMAYTAPNGSPLAQSRPVSAPTDQEITEAAQALTPKVFEIWKLARMGQDGRSLNNPQIADIMTERGDLTSDISVAVALNKAKKAGFPAIRANAGIDTLDTTWRVLALKVKGLSNRQIAERVFPDRDPLKSANNVAKLIGNNQDKLKALQGGGASLAHGGDGPIKNDFRMTAEERDFILNWEEGATEETATAEIEARPDVHPFVLKQISAILEWAGKSPNWTAMFNADGSFTQEGVKLQELFAETFEVYLMTGKAPSTAMRSVFASFRRWLLSAYKAFKNGIGNAIRGMGVYTPERIAAHERELGRRMSDQELVEFVVSPEITAIFDRMLAAEDAVTAAQSIMLRDSKKMAQSILDRIDPDKKWTDQRRAKYLEKLETRYADAHERATAALTARLMDEHTRTRTAEWREMERDVRRDVQSEIDERPEHRLYTWMAEGVWRDTREAHAEAAAAQAEDMLALAQSATHDPAGARELDALGFYSAAFEAAKAVRPDVWNMGWDHARNSIVKGGQKINGQRVAPKDTEIAYLGLDEMFYGTKLKGAELAEAVLDHIQAKRLELVQNFARVDPTRNRIREALEAYHEYRMELAAKYGIEFGLGQVMNEDERKIWDALADEALQAEEKFSSEIRMGETREEALARLERESNNLVRGPGDIRLPGKNVPLFEMVIALPPGVPGADYQAPRSHIGGKMQGTLVTAHGEERIDDKGHRTVFVGQVQSDMAQQYREDKSRAGDINKATVEQTAYGYTVISESGQVISDDFGNPEMAQAELESMKAGVFNAPLVSTSEWTNVAVRAMLYKAAREGFQSISFPTAETSEIIQGNDTAAQHYETNVKGALEKLAKQLGGEVRRGSVVADPDGRYRVTTTTGRFAGQYSITDARGADQAKMGDPTARIEPEPETPSAYILDITPAMRAKIVAEGFPLFQKRTSTTARTAPPADLPPMRLNLQAVKEQYGEEALAAVPPAVAKRAAQANDVDQFVEVAQDVRRTLNKKHPKSLWKFLSTARVIGSGNDKISYKGIRDDDGELLKIIGEKKAAPSLIASKDNDTKSARSYDIEQAATAAWEAGYFNGESPPTPAEFLDAIRADIDESAPLYAADDIPVVQEIANAERWAAWFDENDVDIKASADEIRAKLSLIMTGTNETAISPDEAAPFFGMSDGRAVLEALKQGPLRDKLIREETQRRMIAEHGDIMRDGTLMQEAEVYARNEIQHRQFEIELEALADAAGVQASANLVKQQAIENLKTKQVREVLNYNQWRVLEQRWGKKALEAAGKGDMAKAAEYARYRLINSHMYVEGQKLAARIEKTVTYAKSFDGKNKRIKLAKAGKDYLTQIDQILDDYEFRPVTKKNEAQRVELADWFASKQVTLDPLRDLSNLSEEELLAAKQEEMDRSAALAAMETYAKVRNYKSITFEELEAVREQVEMIETMARKEGALMVEDERRLLNLALDDIEAQAIAAHPKELPPESYASYAPDEIRKREWKDYFSELRTMQAIVRMIDGVDGGALARNTIHKLNTAGANGLARLRVEEDRVIALFRAAYGTDLTVLRKDKVNVPGVAVPLAKMERLTVALYWGTEISRRRIMDGYGWDQATVQRILNTLDAKDWAFVQSVWEYTNSLYPEASKAHEDVHGVPLTKQPGLPVVTKFGVIQGNYFPIKYNPHQSSRADQHALTDTAKQVTGRAGTRKATGSTKERVKGKVTMPVLLDFSITLGSHVNEVVGNITTQKAILDAGRIIAHPRTQNLIVSRFGWITYKALLSAMKDTRNGMVGARGPAERIMVRIRNGATNVALGLNLGTVMKQMLGVTNSMVRLGGKNAGAIGGAMWLMRGTMRMGFGAQGMQNGLAFIAERSPYMRVRMQVQNQAIADQQRQINNGKIKADIKRTIDVVSMFMTQRVQYLAVDAPTWLGAYEKFTSSGMSEADAIASADQIVIDAQGSGDVWQVSAFQRGGPMQRIFTNYITAAIATWNLGVNISRETNFRNPGQAAIWAMNMGVLMVVPVIGGMIVNALMSPGGGDDDEPIEEQYIRQQISFLLSPLGLLGQLTSAVGGYAYKGPQGTRAFDEASKFIGATFTAAENIAQGKATTKDAVNMLRPANFAAGVWFGYPAQALDKFVRGAEALATGKSTDPMDLVTGPPRD